MWSRLGAPFQCNIGALIIGIGFWGIITISNDNKEPQTRLGSYIGPYSIPSRVLSCLVHFALFGTSGLVVLRADAATGPDVGSV